MNQEHSTECRICLQNHITSTQDVPWICDCRPSVPDAHRDWRHIPISCPFCRSESIVLLLPPQSTPQTEDQMMPLGLSHRVTTLVNPTRSQLRSNHISRQSASFRFTPTLSWFNVQLIIDLPSIWILLQIIPHHPFSLNLSGTHSCWFI